jgi:hypothetical protein
LPKRDLPAITVAILNVVFLRGVVQGNQ